MLPFIQKSAKIIQIGGGHDHIYPFLKAINTKYKKITVVNIDAHLDTRLDKTFHSGTPFRQFSEEVEGDFKLIQIGIHRFANPESNFQKLAKGKMDVFTFHDLKTTSKNFSQEVFPIIEKIIDHQNDENNALVFSLDCDAIDAGIMAGVSAVNHQGLPFFVVQEILNKIKAKKNAMYFGIYEYNPVYDNLSEKGARAIANLLYHLIEE